MGDVWRGTDVVLGRVVAVKVLKTAMLTDPEFAARFYGEARMMASFRHPGVVEVYDYAGADDSNDEKVAYLVMAYVDGEPLSTRVRQGPMDVAETMSIVAQAADALHAAHQVGVVHRDVKPGNLIVKPTGAVILVDFGVARSPQVTSVTQLNAIVGTALYMAPEQVAKGRVTAATDIYALGAVAYHCIAGHPPFDGDNALQVALRHLEDEPEPLPPHVPLAVRELIGRAMAKQPADRFETAAEFAEAAFAAAGPLDWKRMTGTTMVAPLSPAPPTRAVPVPRDLPLAAPPPPSSRRPPRSQTALLVAVIAMLVLAGGLITAIVLRGQNTPNSTEPPIDVPSQSSSPQVVTSTPGPVTTTTKSSTRTPSTPRTHTPSPSASIPRSTPPTTPPTSSTPTVPPTTPTTQPPTTPPTTPATTAPTTTPPADAGAARA